MELSQRVATLGDLDAIRVIVRRAIEHLQSDFFTPEQVAASHSVMGVDTQLLHDGTYMLLLAGNRIIGCGGWSFRRTLFGGDASMIEREPETLRPLIDAARIRAMYTDPDFTRRGVGRRILAHCEDAARAAGFLRTEMMATMAGEPLYRACGYERLDEPITAGAIGSTVPLVRMGKDMNAGI